MRKVHEKVNVLISTLYGNRIAEVRLECSIVTEPKFYIRLESEKHVINGDGFKDIRHYATDPTSYRDTVKLAEELAWIKDEKEIS